jgi:hypothetical protein
MPQAFNAGVKDDGIEVCVEDDTRSKQHIHMAKAKQAGERIK